MLNYFINSFPTFSRFQYFLLFLKVNTLYHQICIDHLYVKIQSYRVHFRLNQFISIRRQPTGDRQVRIKPSNRKNRSSTIRTVLRWTKSQGSRSRRPRCFQQIRRTVSTFISLGHTQRQSSGRRGQDHCIRPPQPPGRHTWHKQSR